MTEATSLISYEMTAGGDVRYDPIRSTTGAFGPYEVHPQRCRVLRDSDGGPRVGLEHNGDWLVLRPDGPPFAITEAGGGRVVAEKLAALNNDGMPTRVVELDGSEGESEHTTEAIREALRAAGAAP
jgi:hypothetical protein